MPQVQLEHHPGVAEYICISTAARCNVHQLSQCVSISGSQPHTNVMMWMSEPIVDMELGSSSQGMFSGHVAVKDM